MATKNELATVNIRFTPDNKYIIAGVLNTKRARFDIETKSNDLEAQRTPLNIALILDRSSSMESDNKLTFAKSAIYSVLNLLHDEDIVNLVAYDTNVSIIFENARASTRQFLHSLVDHIVTDGSTNLSGGIETGASKGEKADLNHSKTQLTININ
ncbi:unnamed protein product [Rotaria magnacalcarata]|uniref:VWFA domain-containing protein n=1 Tax=Rotaria magnacalcarata TaxID=392030 RepID=A0A816GVC9_9BILA|nr:unnamed protein product [Rotaria magnacalcarata]CAF1680051.1 unnamed protein product [Rotaria magnacalcarata]CAF2161208.1 unnamed protein product [Rotaria magnacalcarata]CAF4002012.1 unnamed protein product [Rotaria magnacalcarata]CAF4002061.1 unnamed protein product [Rotaria magnacalcarata]